MAHQGIFQYRIWERENVDAQADDRLLLTEAAGVTLKPAAPLFEGSFRLESETREAIEFLLVSASIPANTEIVESLHQPTAPHKRAYSLALQRRKASAYGSPQPCIIPRYRASPRAASTRAKHLIWLSNCSKAAFFTAATSVILTKQLGT